MSHPLDEWLPNDTPWGSLPMDVLVRQSAVRNLPTTGHTKDLIKRLQAYEKANQSTPAIKRQYPWRIEPVWRQSYQAAKYLSFKTTSDILNTDILRFVLNCPEPYLWQRALLPSELQTIYQHSHAIRAFRPNNSGVQDEFCIFCFQNIDKDTKELVQCKKCSRIMHWTCSLRAKDVRTPKRPRTCWICYDNADWNLEKFGWYDRAIPAASSGPTTTIRIQLGPSVDATQEPTQPEELESSSSSSDEEDSEDEQPSKTQSTNWRSPSISSLSSSSLSSLSSGFSLPASPVNQLVPSPACRRRQLAPNSETGALELKEKSMVAPSTSVTKNDESISLPGIPALIWQRMQKEREQQRTHEKEGQQAASSFPELFPAFVGHALPAMDADGGGGGELPEVNTAPNNTRSFSVGDSDSTPVHPPDHSAPVPTTHAHALSGSKRTGGSIDHVKALDLVKECTLLAKESVDIRMKSEREVKRAEKKHRREVRKIRKKSDREAERLVRKIRDVKKELLKALGRPEAAEGGAA
ncbi:hypothetical protein QBC32DRAFT_222170 [Pseudoneurospora amorphoporcata]|uniref:PHD-type domain-containing protein n=1 Tax=Pseudoneurospora amorphoporcata TaxID=241081 RepID=A0AAN6NM11_9PEZI|nr:hypothetical protein QBC32DRAFT_222170 [Pseudoneurospora amorphoporcata]